MKQTLISINELLNDLNIASINEQTAREWLIVGGESFEEINSMVNCYAGDIEESKINSSYYSNSRYC